MKRNIFFALVVTLLSSSVVLAQGRGRGPDHGSERGDIRYRISHCYSDLCTAELDWWTGRGGSGVVTVEIRGESGPQLFACSGSSGSGTAPWIAPGKQYIFKLYDSSRCTRDVGRYDRISDQVTVFVRDGGHGKRGEISAYRERCYSDLCTYDVSWRTYGGNSVVTVQIPGETEEKLMSCEGTSGTAHPNWIARGKDYVFRLYVTNECTADVGRFERPANQVVVREN